MSAEPAFQSEPGRELDYRLCGFEGTRLRFRGPMPSFEAPFVAVLGGSETFGKYVAAPYPALLGDWLDMPVANLGVAQAGLSLFSQERWLLDTASRAQLTVLQVLGAQNMTNRLYSVHARRNDRFIGVSPALREIFPRVDFAEINFTGHLLDTLRRTSKPAFDVLVDELKWAWVQRMRRIVTTIRSDVLLLWISDHGPGEARGALQAQEPAFVDAGMLEALGDDILGVVEVVGPPANSLAGKRFPSGEAEAARCLPGPAEHAAIAEAVTEALGRLPMGPGRRTLPRARARGS